MKGLTKRQADILAFIEKHIDENRYPPSVREIGSHFGLVSAAGVHKHIKALVRKNYIQKVDHLSRSIRIVKNAPGIPMPITVELPLLGYVAAGKPIEAVETDGENLAVSADMVGTPEGKYILKVRGESMIDDGILDGDYVVMDSRQEPNNGETVVALINGQEATLKRFFREKQGVRLQPANPAMDPIWIKGGDLSIRGVVIGLWRPYPAN